MTQPAPTIKLYTATGCEPCVEIKKALEKGNYQILGIQGETEIETIDLATEENIGMIEEIGIGEVPSAYYGDRLCKIFIDDKTKRVSFDCRVDDGDKLED